MTEPTDDADGIFPITAAEAAILYDLGWSSGYGWERDWDWWRDGAPADDDATRIRLAEHITAIRVFRARSEAAVRAHLSDAPQPESQPATDDGWMPIETAPDDKEIIIGVPGEWAEAAYCGIAKGAVPAEDTNLTYPWVVLDRQNVVNGRRDVGPGAPPHWKPITP